MFPDDGDDQLTSDEITALTQAFADPLRGPAPSHEVSERQEAVVLRYDLVGASYSQRHDYPGLDLLHETFTLELATALQRETKQEAVFLPQRPDILNFSEVYASLAAPCSVIVLEVSGLACTGLLVVEPTLMLHFIDLLMGGPGGLVDAGELLTARTFTNTERHLIRRLVEFVHHGFRSAWQEICPLGLRMLRAEVDPRHAALFMPGDRVAEFRVDVEWGEVVGDLRLVLPMAALRPFERDLARTAVSPPSPAATTWQGALRNVMDEVEVDLTAVLGRAELTLRQLLELRCGDLIRLDRDPHGTLELLVEGEPKLAVVPGVRQGNMSVTLFGPNHDDEPDDDEAIPAGLLPRAEPAPQPTDEVEA